MRGQLPRVDDVDVGLDELAVPAALRSFTTPGLLDLVATEGERQLAGVLQHVARERHRHVEVQAQRRLSLLVGGGCQPADGVDLLVGVLALAGQPLDRLDGAGVHRGEAVQLEHLTDGVEEVLLGDALGGQPFLEATDRSDLGSHVL